MQHQTQCDLPLKTREKTVIGYLHYSNHFIKIIFAKTAATNNKHNYVLHSFIISLLKLSV